MPPQRYTEWRSVIKHRDNACLPDRAGVSLGFRRERAL